MKMSDELQILTHTFTSHAASSFLKLSKLRREGILCDLTILLEGQKFKAHKVVLASCSDYFLTAICGGKSTAFVSVSNGGHVTIELQNITTRGFAPLLEYAYTSELNVDASDVIDVLSAASCMQMFDVANVCSEFMRSNLQKMQKEPPLVAYPLLSGRAPVAINGQQNEERDSSPPSHGRSNGVSEAMNNLLQVTSAMQVNGTAARNIHQPPMLIPISAMNSYGVSLQHWADTMASTQSLISRLVNGRSNYAASPPSSLSSLTARRSPVTKWGNEHRPSSLQPPSAPRHPNSQPTAHSEGGSPIRIDDDCSFAKEEHVSESDIPCSKPENANDNSNNNHEHHENQANEQVSEIDDRKSVAVKLDAPSQGSDEKSSTRQANQDGAHRREHTVEAENSWQNLQQLYSLRKSEVGVPSPDRATSPGRDEAISYDLLQNSMNPTLLSRFASTDGLRAALMNKYKDVVPKLDNGLSMVPSLTVQRAFLQRQQQLLAQHQLQLQQVQQQQRNTETEKTIPELPIMPPNGQYTSVRRRTMTTTVAKPHQCQICGSRFTRFHNLKQHIKLHSGVKPFGCDECGKKFTRNYTLRLHKMKHVGMRNFQCGTCDAAFANLGEFRAHLRITLHSHLPVNGKMGSPQDNESASIKRCAVPHNAGRFENFDYYRADSPGSSGGGAVGEGSTGTLSPPGLAGSSSERLDIDYPCRSDQSMSLSPQDLSMKRSLSEELNSSINSENKKCRLDHEPLVVRSLCDRNSNEVKSEMLVVE